MSTTHATPEDLRSCCFCGDEVPASQGHYDAEEIDWLPARLARIWCDADCYAGAHTDMHTGEIDLHAELVGA